MIDQIASAVNRAKAILMDLDKKRIETPVQTEELRWLLNTLVDLGTRPHEGKVAEGAFRSVLGMEVSVAGAVKERDDSDRKRAEMEQLARLKNRAPGVGLTAEEEKILNPPVAVPTGAREAERSRGW